MSKLDSIAAEGFTDTAIEAAINTIEFSLRENNTGSFPRGLSLMLRAMSSWIYDKDPFQPLQWTKDLEHFKASSCFLFIGSDCFLRDGSFWTLIHLEVQDCMLCSSTL